jgi:hypothetical protein
MMSTEPRSPKEMVADVRAAVRTSSRYAALFWLLAALRLATGGHRSSDSLPLWQVTVLYGGGALIVGATIGLLKPLTKSGIGKVAVAVIAAFPLALALTPIAAPEEPLHLKVAVSAVVALVLGPIYAWAFAGKLD